METAYRKRLSSISTLAVGVLLVVGCSSSGSTPAPATSGTATPPVPTTATQTSALASSAASAPASAGDAKYTGTIHMAAPTWTGYGMLYLAAQKGFWQQQGLNVDFTIVEDASQRFNALAGKQLDATTVSADSLAQAVAANVPLLDIAPTDTSAGADGIVAKNTIKTVQDLKGKTVAVEKGTASEWFLVAVLQKNGMQLSDITEQNMTAGDAGAAFVAGQLDAAVTWEPWLSKAKATSFGNVLASSADYPNVIMDTMAVRRDFAQQYPGTVTDLLKGYYAALDWYNANQAEGNQVIADFTKSTPDGIASDMSTIHVYSLPEAKTLMGTSATNGQIAQIVQQAAQFWETQGQLQGNVDLSNTIDPSFVNNLQ